MSMSEIREAKNSVRKQLKQITKSMTPEYKAESSAVIVEKCLSSKEYKAAQSIFVFVSMDGEPDTTKLIEKAFADGKTVYVPRCLKDGIMDAIRITSFDDLESGAYGILEPKKELQPTAVEEFDSETTVGFIPCVGATRSRKRLGHGAGYYDRFLEGRKMKKLMLVYGQQILEDVPCDEHDLLMDQVISE